MEGSRIRFLCFICVFFFIVSEAAAATYLYSIQSTNFSGGSIGGSASTFIIVTTSCLGFTRSVAGTLLLLKSCNIDGKLISSKNYG